jgi:ABC-2 type transport system ATP-binding protein
MIELANVTKRYGHHTAVSELSLRVKPGEIFGFIGPNGAGKTTTIKMIAGLLHPTSGVVTVAGYDMGKSPVAAKRHIGFIPDRPYLYEKLTGMDFLMFTADLYGVPREERVPKAELELRRFSLESWGNELIESYSHGMKQRLVMCAALLHSPSVLIVDEPMVGLDPIAIRMVKGLFRKLADDGACVFMSTHTLSVAEELCDRVGFIQKGRLVTDGTVSELQKKSRTGRGRLEDTFLELTLEGGFETDVDPDSDPAASGRSSREP